MELNALTSCHYCGTTSAEAYCCSACEILDQHLKGQWQLGGENQFLHLDKSKFQELYRQGQDEFIFYAEGLHCSSCVHLLEKLPEFCKDVCEARVNFAQSTVKVKLQKDGALSSVAQVISELGYKPSLLNPADDLQEKYRAENRTFLMRIAVAGFCAGNTMLFVVPIYAGLAGQWATAFNWISFGLFLPVLFYSAKPFYQGAWNSLKYKTVNVDLPIVIALWTGFLFSTVNLLRQNGAIYFDSTASFLFLILSARYVLKRVQQNYLGATRAQSIFNSEKYLKLNHQGHSDFIPWNAAEVNDVLVLKAGQVLPADAELLSTGALVDMSLFNGESLPKKFTQGMVLFAGTKVLEQDIQVRVRTTFKNSRLGDLFDQLDKGQGIKNAFTHLTDELAQKLIFVVFSVAMLFFLIYSFVDVSEAFNRALALIVLACPCALAFGTPLTYGLALKNAQKRGILLKDSSAFERILKIKNVFFDKTGTLTEGELSLASSSETIDSELQRIILTLESQSYHPIAFALRKAWPLPESLAVLENGEEILGQGVHGHIAGHFYEIQHLAESTHDTEIAVQVLRDGEILCRLYFVDALRKDSAKVVRTLQRQGLRCFLLSGDAKVRVWEVAKSCAIPRAQSFGDLYPEDKKAILASHSHSCMIGDGANDSLSLQQADIGIAVKGSVDLSLQSADVYFTRGGLMPFLDFFKLAKQTQRVLYRNISISLLYNTVGGCLALLGFISPMMAAILMPLSSGLIVLSSLWGAR
jgi:Cu2+-exporting ATPase/Cu+-exporting ATPase